MQQADVDLDFVMSTMGWLWPGTTIDMASRSRSARADQNTFLLLPNRRRVRVIAPARPRQAAAAALTRNSSPVSVRQGAARAVGRVGLWSGLGALLPDQLRLAEGDDPVPSILDFLGQSLGENVTVGISIGTPRANRKPVLRVMDRKGRTLAFAKVGFTPITKELVQREARALRRLGQCEWRTFTVPTLINYGTFNSCDVVLMAPVPTKGTKGQRDSQARRAIVQELSTGFGTAKDAVHGGDFMNRLRSQLGTDPGHGLVTALSASLDSMEAQFTGESVVLGASHGDFTPWNMVTWHGVARVWDWERFDTRIPVGLDEIHYCVNSFTQQNGFTPQSILSGLRESTWPYPDRTTALVHHACYLASISTRYLSDLGREGGQAAAPTAAAAVEALALLLGNIAAPSMGG